MSLFLKLADKLFGRTTPVAPFVQQMIDGLATSPDNYSGTLRRTAEGITFHIRQLRGTHNDAGLVATIKRADGLSTLTFSTFVFEDVPLNFRERRLLVDAIAVWMNAIGIPTKVGGHAWLFMQGV